MPQQAGCGFDLGTFPCGLCMFSLCLQSSFQVDGCLSRRGPVLKVWFVQGVSQPSPPSARGGSSSSTDDTFKRRGWFINSDDCSSRPSAASLTILDLFTKPLCVPKQLLRHSQLSKCYDPAPICEPGGSSRPQQKNHPDPRVRCSLSLILLDMWDRTPWIKQHCWTNFRRHPRVLAH